MGSTSQAAISQSVFSRTMSAADRLGSCRSARRKMKQGIGQVGSKIRSRGRVRSKIRSRGQIHGPQRRTTTHQTHYLVGKQGHKDSVWLDRKDGTRPAVTQGLSLAGMKTGGPGASSRRTSEPLRGGARGRGSSDQATQTGAALLPRRPHSRSARLAPLQSASRRARTCWGPHPTKRLLEESNGRSRGCFRRGRWGEEKTLVGQGGV